MSPPTTQNEKYFAQALECRNPQEAMTVYDNWATGYDTDVTSEARGYNAPTTVAQTALNFASDPATTVILDAGCGTGLVGAALTSLGAKIIDGIDLSQEMLNQARKRNLYRDLAQADLTRPIDKAADVYDIATCVGTFTTGHVGPVPALRELTRVTKPQGIVVATVRAEAWLAMGFKAEVEKMKEEGLVTVISDGYVDYLKGSGVQAILLVLRKNT